jgi:PucR family transcriptional regulator, purine catabolism regulatory protein
VRRATAAPRRLHEPQDTFAAAAAGAARDAEALAACQRLLSPLRRSDADHGSRLEATLRAYYACGASVSRTAQALFLHRNSVRYRLDRVRALLGADIDHPEVSATLLMALAVDAAAARHEDEEHAAQRAQ